MHPRVIAPEEAIASRRLNPTTRKEDALAKVIAIANQKGGSGKTTTTRSLSAALAEKGQPVLMVDLDPQASLSEGCGVELYKVTATTYHVLLGTAKMGDIIIPIDSNVDLAPAN